MKTTAQLRNEARDAEAKLDFALAAKLYREAVAAHKGTGALAEKDKVMLSSKAQNCESFVKEF